MTSTETLKAHVFDTPAPIDDGTPAIVKAMQPKARPALWTPTARRACLIEPSRRCRARPQDKFSAPSTATNKPVIATLGERRSGKQQNEIYVDLLERLTVIFNASVRVLSGGEGGKRGVERERTAVGWRQVGTAACNRGRLRGGARENSFAQESTAVGWRLRERGWSERRG